LHDTLAGDGTMEALVRTFDWEGHRLGPRASWPTSLKTTVGIVLGSRFPMLLWWGPDLWQLYNDGYRPILGDKHPASLGAAGREVWAEIWHIIGPMAEGVLAGGPATWSEHLLLPIIRKGYVEETYFTFSYSPVPGDDGRTGGVLVTVQETTEQVQGDRQLQMLNELAARTAEGTTTAEVCTSASVVLSSNDADFPFVLLYLVSEDGEQATLAAGHTLEGAPSAVDMRAPSGDEPWPLLQASLSGRPVLVELPPALGHLTGGRWPEPPRQAMVLPLSRAGQPGARGFLVTGVSPRRALDERYLGLFRLTTEHLATALTHVRAWEEERARAAALAEIDRTKTAFFSNISHEFRTPLTLMLGPTEDLLTDGASRLQPQDLEQIELVHRNARRLSKLVNGLLDFSRLEAGRIQASYREVDLSAFTSELAGVFRAAIEREGLALHVDCQPPGAAVWVDPEMWQKIVFNLLSNALKFTFEGSVSVRLRPVADQAVQLVVSDTGTGISPEEVPRLFERFHRIEGVRARTHEGSGIGLAMVQELVKLHGGSIAVDSEPGVGTTFTVTLPTGRQHLPADRAEQTAEPVSAGLVAASFLQEATAWTSDLDLRASPVTEPSAHILVADDNADLRAYLARVLGSRWSVEVVADGQTALDRARQRLPELVITDVMMPGLDGFALLRALRADERTREVPVVMLSARAGEEARVSGLQAGADDYLVKPFSARELLARVQTQLALGRALRERAALALREQEARQEAELQRTQLYSLFMQAPTPIVILRGPQHIVELANAWTCRVWGRAPEDVLGRPLLEALAELDGQVFSPLLDAVMKTGEAFVGREVPARLERDGGETVVYFNFVYSPLRDLEGKVERVLVIATDVTAEVGARQQMERLRGAAEQANRSKDEFLAMLGHELRNPLAPMLTALQIVRLRGGWSREHDVLERQVRHLTRLVDDLLDVSRITRGKVSLHREPVELAEIVSRGIEIASPLLEKRAHLLHFEVPREGLLVYADAGRLAQVVSNLLTNAAKYSDPGSPISVYARREAGAAHLAVRDDGIGIAPELIGRVFEPFTQHAQSLARSTGGLGLGLAIVKSLVELHGGEVSAHSEGAGLGSEFVVCLPLMAPGSRVSSPPAEVRQRRSTLKRVLVVDDNEDAAETLRSALERMGHVVEIAYDGPSALLAAERFGPEVALLDIGLPVMDGYELAARLRAAAPGPLRLVAVTGYGQDADQERALAAGFARHVVKPVDLGRITALVEEWTDPGTHPRM
jgi:PAS domain S-box-containing protein